MKNGVILILTYITVLICITGCQKQKDTVSNIPSSENIEISEEVTTLEDVTIEGENTQLPSLPQNEEELQSIIESERGFSPEDERNLTDDYFTPETYNENGVDVQMYFTNTEKIYSQGFLPGEAVGTLLENVQTYLINAGYPDTKEMKVISGTESKTEAESSFIFTLDAYPGISIILIYNNEKASLEFGLVANIG